MVQLEDPKDAEAFAAEVTAAEIVRLENAASADGAPPAVRVTVAEHPVLMDFMGCTPFRDGGLLGVEFHRYYVGAELSIDAHGRISMLDIAVDIEDPPTFDFQIMPLGQMYGRRISSLWGLDGKPGTWRAREDTATRALIRKLQELGESQLRMGGTSLPMVEVRSIKIGELKDGSPVHGYMILGCSDAISLRINAAADHLESIDMKLVTMDHYRELAIAAKEAGNQVLDDAEAGTIGRKFMLWGTPRNLTAEKLRMLAADYFGDEFEDCDVAVSRACHPYAWVVVKGDCEKDDKLRLQVADFEAVAQSAWSCAVHLALSKSRQARIRMKAQHRDRMDQRDALHKPAGQLKEILIDPKLVQDALLDAPFMDIWVDALYSRIGKRLITDIAGEIESRVQALVEARLEIELGKKFQEFEQNFLQKVLATIDSAVDFSMERAIEARALEIAEGASGYGQGLDIGDLEVNLDAARSMVDEELSELEKTVEIEDLVEPGDAASQPLSETQPMPTDSAAAKRTRADVDQLDKMAAVADELAKGPIAALKDSTNTEEQENQEPASRRKFVPEGTTRKSQVDIRKYAGNGGRQ
jgi:hypothetical protein